MGNIILELKDIEARKGIFYPHISVKKGEVLFITGESGVGKSTLFQVCNGILSPVSGEVLLNAQNIDELDPLIVRKNVLLLGQEVFLFAGTILHNFTTFYAYRDEACPSKDEIQSYLKLCNIDRPLEYDCNELSGGEKQRVYIAIFLSFNPQIFLLDEPTASLDLKNAHEIIGNIVKLVKEKNMGLMIISHTEDLLCHADGIIHLKKD